MFLVDTATNLQPIGVLEYLQGPSYQDDGNGFQFPPSLGFSKLHGLIVSAALNRPGELEAVLYCDDPVFGAPMTLEGVQELLTWLIKLETAERSFGSGAYYSLLFGGIPKRSPGWRYPISAAIFGARYVRERFKELARWIKLSETS